MLASNFPDGVTCVRDTNADTLLTCVVDCENDGNTCEDKKSKCKNVYDETIDRNYTCECNHGYSGKDCKLESE